MIHSLIHGVRPAFGFASLRTATSIFAPKSCSTTVFKRSTTTSVGGQTPKNRKWQYIVGAAIVGSGIGFYFHEKTKITMPFPWNIGVKPVQTLVSGDYKACYYSPIPDSVFKMMRGKSHKDKCPLTQSDLAYVRLRHYGMDGKIHKGELVVHQKIAPMVLEIFKDIFNDKFQIQQMTLIDVYDADDDESMKDNNSSAFCYRTITNQPGKLSNHALGLAIDINPRLNPFVRDRVVAPKNGAKYTDRTLKEPGMIQPESEIVKAFKRKDFNWGGDWKELKDYQHFEMNILKKDIENELKSRKTTQAAS